MHSSLLSHTPPAQCCAVLHGSGRRRRTQAASRPGAGMGARGEVRCVPPTHRPCRARAAVCLIATVIPGRALPPFALHCAGWQRRHRRGQATCGPSGAPQRVPYDFRTTLVPTGSRFQIAGASGKREQRRATRVCAAAAPAALVRPGGGDGEAKQRRGGAQRAHARSEARPRRGRAPRRGRGALSWARGGCAAQRRGWRCTRFRVSAARGADCATRRQALTRHGGSRERRGEEPAGPSGRGNGAPGQPRHPPPVSPPLRPDDQARHEAHVPAPKNGARATARLTCARRPQDGHLQYELGDSIDHTRCACPAAGATAARAADSTSHAAHRPRRAASRRAGRLMRPRCARADKILAKLGEGAPPVADALLCRALRRGVACRRRASAKPLHLRAASPHACNAARAWRG